MIIITTTTTGSYRAFVTMRYYSFKCFTNDYPWKWIQCQSCTHSAPFSTPLGTFWPGTTSEAHTCQTTYNICMLPGTQNLYTWVESSNVDYLSCWRMKVPGDRGIWTQTPMARIKCSHHSTTALAYYCISRKLSNYSNIFIWKKFKNLQLCKPVYYFRPNLSTYLWRICNTPTWNHMQQVKNILTILKIFIWKKFKSLQLCNHSFLPNLSTYLWRIYNICKYTTTWNHFQQVKNSKFLNGTNLGGQVTTTVAIWRRAQDVSPANVFLALTLEGETQTLVITWIQLDHSLKVTQAGWEPNGRLRYMQ